MLQGSKLERNVPDDGTSLLQVCHRGSRNSHQHADTRMTGSRARWTVVLVLVIGVSFVGTVSGIDVYPNNEGQFSYPNAYQAGGVVSHSHDYGSYGQPNTDESYYRPDVSQYQPGSQPGYGGAPQPGYNAQRFDYEDDLTPRNQNSNVDGGDDYLTNDGEEHDYYDGDASAVESSAGSSSGNGVQNARDSGKMGYGGGLQQYGPQGQDVYGGGGGGGGGGYGGGGGGVGGYGGGGGGGGGVGGYGGGGGGYGGGGGGYSPQYSNQQYTGYSYSNMYQPQQQPKVIKVIERVPIKEKIYVPVYKKRKKKKKKKQTLTKYYGSYIEGGSQLYGKFKSLYECMHYCEKIPTCFAGDYNPWLKKCYIHSNLTACDTLQTNKNIVHFKKVPCIAPETTNGLVTLGAHLLVGIEIKGIKDLQHCIQKCANTGQGIAPDLTELHVNDFPQLCAGIDYDFSNYKCYFLVGSDLVKELCPVDTMPPPTPRDLVAKPSVVNVLLCPPLPP